MSVLSKVALSRRVPLKTRCLSRLGLEFSEWGVHLWQKLVLFSSGLGSGFEALPPSVCSARRKERHSPFFEVMLKIVFVWKGLPGHSSLTNVRTEMFSAFQRMLPIVNQFHVFIV